MNKPYNFTAIDAVREQIKLRAGFSGPTGSGKSLSTIKLGARMVERLGCGPLFVIDSEHRSALRYAHSQRTGQGYRFKHVAMPEDDNSPDAYLGALKFSEDQGAGVIVIDSLSHMWAGIGGVLEQVDQTTQQSRTKNSFSEGWKTWTPIHARAIERIMQSPAHILFTTRAKVEWVVQENERGKKEPVKVGLAPVAREGLDYEPDFFAEMEAVKGDAVLWISKSRALGWPALKPGTKYVNPGDEFADAIIAWIEDGEAPRDPLDVALDEAVASSTDKASFTAARDKLAAFMSARGIPTERGSAVLATFAQRVKAALAPPAAAAPA